MWTNFAKHDRARAPGFFYALRRTLVITEKGGGQDFWPGHLICRSHMPKPYSEGRRPREKKWDNGCTGEPRFSRRPPPRGEWRCGASVNQDFQPTRWQGVKEINTTPRQDGGFFSSRICHRLQMCREKRPGQRIFFAGCCTQV